MGSEEPLQVDGDERKTVVVLESIVLDGVPEGVRAKAEWEIRFAAKSLEDLDAAGLDRAADEVVVRYEAAADFESAVRRVLRESGKPGWESYRATRESVMAYGKTISKWDGRKLAATLIVPGELWEAESDQAAFIRLYLLLHEGAHVYFNSRRGEVPLSRTFGESLRALARIVREEYSADWVADRFIGYGVFTDENGAALRLPQVIGDWYAVPALRLFEGLGVWVEECVQGYREHRVPLEQIDGEILPKLEELFTVLAHLLGTNIEDEGVERCRDELEASAGFQTYLAEDWDRFVLGVTGADGEAGRAALVEVLTKVLERCGIEVEDLDEDRRFIHVFEPRFLT